MPRYLIDENLPYYFELWNSDKFVHDLTGMKTDAQIREYFRLNDLIIVSKGCDFSNRIISKTPPPKVIHIRCGNTGYKNYIEFSQVCGPRLKVKF